MESITFGTMEQWISENEPLVSLGFAGDFGQVIYIPLEFPISAERIIEDYHAKIIIKRIATGQILSVDIPIVKRHDKPWGKWRITKRITNQSGLISFQFRAINDFYRLLCGKVYRGIIFDAIGEQKIKEVMT